MLGSLSAFSVLKAWQLQGGQGTMVFHTTKPRTKNVQRHFYQNEGNAENKTN